MDSVHTHYEEVFVEDFHVSHTVNSNGKEGKFHIHRVFEVLFVRTPNAVCEVAGKTLKTQKNSLLLFNDTDLHRVFCPIGNVYDRYVLFFQPEYIETLSSEQTDLLRCFLQRPFPVANYLPLNEQEATEIEFYMNRILQISETQKTAFGNDLLRKFAAGELLIHLNRLYFQKHSALEMLGSLNYRQAYRVAEYINAHLSENLSLSSLSNYIFVSPNYLCRLFKSTIGTSPMQYVTCCRILKAKEYLSQGYTVDETCSLVGFNNLSHFSNVFKRIAGISPKKYAILQRNQE